MDYRKKLALFGAYYLLKKNSRKVTVRRYQVHPINSNKNNQSDWYYLVAELRLDKQRFHNYFRMGVEAFDKLLEIVGPSIQKIDTYREVIAPGARLAITLRFLVSGDSQVSLSYAYRVGKSTVSNLINETCSIIWQKLKTKVFMEITQTNWLSAAHNMEKRWNFPHCLGAIDGKHVVIQAPSNSGSEFYNYKHSHSIVLMAIADYNYKFIMVDIGASGRQSDGGIFRNSQMGIRFEDGSLQLPSEQAIIENTTPMPYFLVGDEAFQLSTYLLRPYPGRETLDLEKKIFNYRLSRCRRLIENAFGIMVSRFRIFRKPIIGKVDNIVKYVEAATCLHNYIIDEEKDVCRRFRTYIPTNFVDVETSEGEILLGEWRKETASSGLIEISKTAMGSNRAVTAAVEIRDFFAQYFISDEGALEWQWDKI